MHGASLLHAFQELKTIRAARHRTFRPDTRVSVSPFGGLPEGWMRF